MALMPAERRNQIRAIIRERGSVRVVELSELFEVSGLTIRRDLELLEREDVLERTHGGAVCSQRMRRPPLYTEKGRLHPEEKRKIGAAAASLVEDGDTLLVGSGSTTLQIFQHLGAYNNLRVMTTNMGAVPEMHGMDLDLIMIGGQYTAQSNSVIGPLATLGLRQVYANKCFIGVDGISLKYGLTNPLFQWAEVLRLMIERTRGEVVVVADHSKFGVVADFVIAAIEQVDVLVVDGKFDENYRDDLEELGVQIIVAD